MALPFFFPPPSLYTPCFSFFPSFQSYVGSVVLHQRERNFFTGANRPPPPPPWGRKLSRLESINSQSNIQLAGEKTFLRDFLGALPPV